MNLKHLETYHYFCRSLCMSRAAQDLSISQPAVSQQLRNFEAECGVKLFYREANQYRLTETGEALFLLSKRVFNRVEQMEEILENARTATAERLRIGSVKAYARTVMPDLLSQFQQQFPRVQVRLSEGNSQDLLHRLRNRQEDLVVVARRDYDHALRAIPFAGAEFVLVSRPDHPLAERSPVSISELSGEPLILREHGSGSRAAIMRKLGDHNVTPAVVIESESLSFILAYIQRRMGISFILSHEIEDELETGILRRIDLLEGKITFQADLVVVRDRPMSMPMRSFVRIATQQGNARGLSRAV